MQEEALLFGDNCLEGAIPLLCREQPILERVSKTRVFHFFDESAFVTPSHCISAGFPDFRTSSFRDNLYKMPFRPDLIVLCST